VATRRPDDPLDPRGALFARRDDRLSATRRARLGLLFEERRPASAPALPPPDAPLFLALPPQNQREVDSGAPSTSRGLQNQRKVDSSASSTSRDLQNQRKVDSTATVFEVVLILFYGAIATVARWIGR